MTREDAEQALTKAGQAEDRDFPLLEAALACAVHEDPARDPAEARALSEQIAERLKRRLQSESPEEAIAETLSGDFRFNGDLLTWDDPSNADVIDVAERRRGISVALGVFYLDAARRTSSDGNTTRPSLKGSSASGPSEVSMRSRKWPGKSTPSTGRAQRRAASR